MPPLAANGTDHLGDNEIEYRDIVNSPGTSQPLGWNSGRLASDAQAEHPGIQAFWLGRQRIYAEFSSPEDEYNTFESGCLSHTDPSIRVLIYDHSTQSLRISTGMGEVKDTKHIILRLPDRSTKPIYIYKECLTTDAAKCAPVFRAFRKIGTGGHEPVGMSFKSVVHLNKLSWAGKFKIKTGQIRWLFFVNLDRSLSGLSEKSQTTSSSGISYV